MLASYRFGWIDQIHCYHLVFRFKQIEKISLEQRTRALVGRRLHTPQLQRRLDLRIFRAPKAVDRAVDEARPAPVLEAVKRAEKFMCDGACLRGIY